jgi:hypothetical protein
MSGRTVKLSQRKQAAIIALITQPTVAEAARVANVRPNTLGRWKKEPAFDAGNGGWESKETSYAAIRVGSMVESTIRTAPSPAGAGQAAERFAGQGAAGGAGGCALCTGQGGRKSGG